MHPQKVKILNVIGSEPKTMDELGHAVINYINSTPIRLRTKNRPAMARVTGLHWQVAYSDEISNSHACPLSGVTNWCGRHSDRPESYKGFIGRIWVRLREYTDIWASELLQQALIHTGTGGGGAYSGPWEEVSTAYWKHYGHKKSPEGFIQPSIYSWDVKIFTDDWPEIAKSIERQQTFMILQDKKFRDSSNFYWECPESIEHDKQLREFISNKSTLAF